MIPFADLDILDESGLIVIFCICVASIFSFVPLSLFLNFIMFSLSENLFNRNYAIRVYEVTQISHTTNKISDLLAVLNKLE